MLSLDPVVSSWLLTVSGILGLCSALLARISEGSRTQTTCQVAFLACMALVGVATLLACCGGNVGWTLGGAVLGVMAVGATLDTRRAHQPAVL